MGVDQDRRQTARARRTAIISALNRGFDLSEGTSHLSAFRDLVRTPEPRLVVTNADIDGIVSAQMLCSVTGWQVVAIIDRDGDCRVHPDYGTPQELVDSGRVYGVDLFSPLFPGISNHPVLFGTTPKTPASVREHLKWFDDGIDVAIESQHIINLSAWVGIGALFGSTKPNGLPYKYPLGTAQLLLAVLEAADLNPRMYDRQYLPWLIANCDGGIDTIRTYAWNAETWWSAMAAAVGPASHSESIYRMVTNQRPNEFTDVDRRLRYDEPERSSALNTKWNLTSTSAKALAVAVSLIADLSGWPDPFLGGAVELDHWRSHTTTRNVLSTKGITGVPTERLLAHLGAASQSIHCNFSVFKERGTALGWLLPRTEPKVEQLLGAAMLTEDLPEDEPTIPDEAGN